MLKVWGRRNSLNVQKVMWLVGELGLEHERIDAGGPFGGLGTDEYGALNPNRLVPVLEDGNLAIWESHAILRYLAARHGGARWWPGDPAARSWSDRWMDWCLAHWQPAFSTGVFWGYYRTPEARRDAAAIRRAIAQCAELMLLIEQALADRPYLAGDDLTLADIPLGASLYRYFTLDIDRRRLPAVEAWYARLAARPAFRDHVMVPYDELKGRLAF
jgi:glutathione S-transferase